jgi:hypothetical protein
MLCAPSSGISADATKSAPSSRHIPFVADGPASALASRIEKRCRVPRARTVRRSTSASSAFVIQTDDSDALANSSILSA